VSKVIDVHVHVGISSTLQVAGGAEDILKLMDFNGIDQSVISPIPGYTTSRGIQDSVEQNNNIAEAVRRWPDRFPRGLGVVEPRHGKRALMEIDRMYEQLGLHGLMFHNDFNGVTVDDSRMYAILDRSSEFPGKVIMIHTAQQSMIESPIQFMAVANAFPELIFVDAHSMMLPAQLSASEMVARTCPNVYFDTCLSYHHDWPIERAVKTIGAERMVFGSDNPYFYRCVDKVIIEWAEINKEQREQIFFKTASKVFAL
jgi:hypothetical protein